MPMVKKNNGWVWQRNDGLTALERGVKTLALLDPSMRPIKEDHGNPNCTFYHQDCAGCPNACLCLGW